MRSWINGVLIGAAVAASMPLSAAAQTVYRCGADGRSYSQQACDDGRPVRVDDARSPGQRHEAEQVSVREARVARQLESDRLAAQRAPQGMVGIDGRGRPAAERSAVTRPASKKRREAPPSPAVFRAAVPKAAKPKPAPRD